jgi:VWFA-related protein
MRQRIVTLVGTLAIAAAPFVHGSWSSALTDGSDPNQEQPTFRASTDLVSVDVSVRVRGRAVVGLEAKDFEVADNGVAQRVLDVSYEKLPIDITVALDVSQSVTGALLNQLRRSVAELKADLNPRDRLKLITFNIRIKRLMDFSEDTSGADAALAGATAFGGTALLDSLAVALVTPVVADRRHLVMLFSDGIDSSSVSDADAVLEVARHSTATIGFVLLALSSPITPSIDAARDLYARLARETGGTVFNVAMGMSLSETFRRTLEEFRSSYVLHFTPTGVVRGGVHTLDVRVTRPGADVRARKGYAWR